MSKRIWQFLIADMKTVRVTCQHQGCGLVMEVPTDKLDQHFPAMTCPGCRRHLFKAPPGGANPFLYLAEAFRLFSQHTSDVQIEFVADDPS